MTRSRARSTNITMFIPIPCQAGRLGNGPIVIVGSSHISLRCLINLFEYPEATPPGYQPFYPASLAARHFAARLLGTWQHVALREQQVSGQGFVPRNSYTQRGNLPVVGQPIYRGPNFYSVYFSKKSLQTKHIFTHQLYVSHPWRISSVGWQQMHRSKPRRVVFKNQICGLWVVCKKDEINDSMFDFLVTFLGIWLWIIGSCLGGTLTSTGSGLLHKLVTTNPASEKCAARWREPYPTTWCVLLVDLADPTLGKCICCPNHPETYRAVHAREPWLLFPIGITNLTIIYKKMKRSW